MRNLIAALLAWLLGVLAPGSGRRGVGPQPTAPTSVRRPEGVGPTGAPARQRTRARATRPRSPYGLGERLAGEDSALVRPYLVAYEWQEERARQHLRRLSLVMAADFGIDLDARDVHAAGAAW
ncbi:MULTISPECIES: hypothetical protein [unclassified Streptomyces]|uniref:hypothetical protein n=1 Tax=unclassified Streptomyces TaxID=2593676 RepID=UPI00081B26E1|nr:MULTISPECIES: hypothetical protein [unclassified Streptomyces]MYQ85219.1 hypothetical protein [Streptomyces sp. SID4936]SCE00153.1 hypothetical protein GA0115234_1055371 [Streptomyces sp. DvalAA-43]